MSTQTLEKKKSWYVILLTSTIGRKLLMALTGLFLILFLTVHLSGNLQLLVPDEGESFNKYAKFMGHNPLIQTVSIGNFTFIILHIIYGIALALYNKNARPKGYHYNKPERNSSWASRKMIVLGTIVLIFIVVHLVNFWGKMKLTDFGAVELVNTVQYDGVDYLNLYALTKAAFSELWLVILYVIAMIGLALHLVHGFQSAFQTLGLNHKKYTPIIKIVGVAYSILVPLGFAIIPIYMYVQNLM